MREAGYQFQLLFFWLESPELNIQRVAERVQRGGHHIPEAVIRRRYVNGVQNFFNLYAPLADIWGAYDNTRFGSTRIIAEGRQGQFEQVFLPDVWQRMKEVAGNE